MNIIEHDRVAVVDVDDTLVCWNLSDFSPSDRITIEFINGPVEVVPHRFNINTLIKFYKLGYTIIVHSGSGYEWATVVVQALGLEPYVHTVMSKPMYYFDDMPAQQWLNNRVYRDPKTGESRS